ncbi:MAG: Nif3-like dinuclear metal center hexameric protein [Acidobacteria bacterium]|nr:MAG: Nif3-like dinuclear metal center hexameric protein [Acidobacteriota bacterium]
MLVGSLVDALDERFPFRRAASWDPVGLQLGAANADVGSVSVCHEVTPDVARTCLETGVDTLVSYHPLLFDPVTSIVDGPTAEGTALRLLGGSISLVVVHTAMDVAEGGTGDQLADALGVKVEGHFAETEVGVEDWIGRFGVLTRKTTLSEFSQDVARALGSDVRVSHSTDATVTKVAVVPGSGSSFTSEAAALADVYVTGDIGHHSVQTATRLGIGVIDAGHIPTERPGVKHLYDVVRKIAPNAEFVRIDPHPWEGVSWSP